MPMVLSVRQKRAAWEVFVIAENNRHSGLAKSGEERGCKGYFVSVDYDERDVFDGHSNFALFANADEAVVLMFKVSRFAQVQAAPRHVLFSLSITEYRPIRSTTAFSILAKRRMPSFLSVFSMGFFNSMPLSLVLNPE